MTGIELWSTTAANNNSSPPNGAPEGMAPSSVNDTMRQMMAATRSWYENAQWINFGYTHVYVATTQFKVAATDVTAIYTVGRRVKAVGASTGTIYGTITVSSFSTDTTITVSWDSGTLANETLTIYAGILTFTNSAAPTPFPVIDTTAVIKGSGDATKLLRFEVDGFTTGTTRVLTPPNFDGTIATLAGTESLTNKSLVDASVNFVDDGDATKKLAFQCSGVTTGTTRTLTAPDASGTILLVYTPITASLGSDVNLNNVSNYFDGPSIAQGSTGTWWVSGTVTVQAVAGGGGIANHWDFKLWDGTTVIASAGDQNPSDAETFTVSLSGYLSSPASNLRISVKNETSTAAKILFNYSGNSKDSTISAFRIA